MIGSFGNQLTRDLYLDKKSKSVSKFPPEIRGVARRKLFYLDRAKELKDLKIPPGNKLEALKGNLKGYHSIIINDQWRVIFIWNGGEIENVKICDYHRG